MEIYANILQKVDINPKDVIQGLLEKELGFGDTVFEKDGRYYKREVEYRQPIDTEISKEKFEYVEALKLVLKNL